tara:strand:+ start:486 stop:1235 length:750 start_codon:yes stop_codon:yes gene_type:complete
VSRVTKDLAFIFRRTIFWFGFYLRPPIHWFIGLFSKVGNPPVFQPDTFEWTSRLEKDWTKIRDESLSVLETSKNIPPLREVSPDHSRIAIDDKWKVFFLWGYKYEIQENTVRCPITSGMLNKIPGLISAFFSIHTPGTYLPRHYGPSNGLITCHLGLSIPENKEGCKILIDGKPYNWEEGKFLVFDDTYYHEVWNNTAEDRVVLLIHIERPLRQPGKAIADGFLWLATHSPFIQSTIKSLEEWTVKKER